jgi:hypothetical protein
MCVGVAAAVLCVNEPKRRVRAAPLEPIGNLHCLKRLTMVWEGMMRI